MGFYLTRQTHKIKPKEDKNQSIEKHPIMFSLVVTRMDWIGSEYIRESVHVRCLGDSEEVVWPEEGQ